jgi:predicted O-methyltransferase YrrM
MHDILENIFTSREVESPSLERIKIHSNTSREQCVFLQELFDLVKPERSIEVGLAFGISALAILEMHKKNKSAEKAHIIIEPFPWKGVAEHNLEMAGLMELADIHYHRSDEVLPRLFYEGVKLQYAYIDTTKVFDTVLTDFYFIDKMLSPGGVVIFDDCGGAWPGVQRVVRFVRTLPHYEILAGHNKIANSGKRKAAGRLVATAMGLIPFKQILYPDYNFRSDSKLGLNYSCLAFRKTSEDSRHWDWHAPI